MSAEAANSSESDLRRAAREAQLEQSHKEFLKSMASSRSVPVLQSSMAGASGRTNQLVRIHEDQEAERLLKMRLAAEVAAKDKAYQEKQAQRAEALTSAQAKKRAKRLKRTASKKSRGASRSDDESSSEAE